jgi:hypothetical protein
MAGTRTMYVKETNDWSRMLKEKETGKNGNENNSLDKAWMTNFELFLMN